MTVLEAIQLLLRVEGPTTPPKITRVSKLDYRHVLEVLDRNSELLLQDNRRRITGLSASKPIARMFKAGLVYSITEINYGCDRALHFYGPLRDEMAEPYWNGGFGDSWQTQEVLWTEENEARLQAEGLVYFRDLRLADFWKEEPPAWA